MSKDNEQIENLIDHIVTQSDLDLNPDWAEDGVKVGETVQVEKEVHEDLLALSKSEEKEGEEEDTEEEEEVVTDEVKKTLVPTWALTEGADPEVPVENTLVKPEEEDEEISKENIPEWAKE